jgi:hypothetical protein
VARTLYSFTGSYTFICLVLRAGMINNIQCRGARREVSLMRHLCLAFMWIGYGCRIQEERRRDTHRERELFIDSIHQVHPRAVAPYGVSPLFSDIYLPTFRLR